MITELALNPQTEAFKSACQKLGTFLDDKTHGKPDSQKGHLRAKKLVKETEAHGPNSLYFIFKEPYLQGYGVVTSTLRLLGRSNIHTDSDLISADLAHVQSVNVDFGEQKLELATLFREVISTRNALAS